MSKRNTDTQVDENQEESLFDAPHMTEQERMVEAILFATADLITIKELQGRMPHGCDVAEALVYLRKHASYHVPPLKHLQL